MRRNLSRLASGTILSQALMVASTPMLTRVFSPDAFGVMAVFSAAYVIAIPFITLKYDAAVILPRAGRGAVGLSTLVILISTGLSLVAGWLLWMAGHLMLLSDANELKIWLPLALWLGALYTLTQQWSARKNSFKHFAISQVIGTVLNIATSLILGLWLGGKPLYLVLGFVCGMAGSLSYMYFNRFTNLLDHSTQSLRSLLRRARVYSQFPLLVLPTTLLTAVGQNSIPFVLALYYPMDNVGQFAIANRLLLVPAALIGGALTEAFRSEFVRRQRDRLGVTGLYLGTLQTIVFFAIPTFGILALAAPWLFMVVFGTAYADAGHLASVMIVGVAAQFIGNPFACVFVALRRADIGLRVQIAATVIPLILLTVASAFNVPLTTALGCYAAASAATMATMLLIAFRLCHASDGTIKAGT
jgi:O-antigen/teichoic acid export membrane protein